jgi:flagellar basal-body rod modification protein FlgD
MQPCRRRSSRPGTGTAGQQDRVDATTGIADNFQTFLTLLTTQLQHQNPLDPLDQPVHPAARAVRRYRAAAQVERTVEALIEIEKSAGDAGAGLCRQHRRRRRQAGAVRQIGDRNFQLPKDTSATITITNSAGQTAYTGSYTLKQGSSSFVWDGKGNDGVQWPAGTYTLTATGKDSSGNNVAISTEVQGVVDSVDLSASPPLLSIGGQSYTTDKIKRVVRSGASS